MAETRITELEAGELRAKTVHVDTSLQIEQQKRQEQSQPVRIALAQYRFVSTSTYAKKEFKRAWLQDLNLLYKTANGCITYADVQQKIVQSLYRPEAKRRLNRCFDALCVFLDGQSIDTPIGVLVIRLRSHLAEAIMTGFLKWERSVTHEHNGTDCIRAKERPIRAANGAIDVVVRDCRPTKIQCSVHTFFESQQDHFDKIRTAIANDETPSAELQRTAEMIELAKIKPSILCDNSKCSAMSDALIAVDGRDMDVFAANNPREWNTIASALGKPLINPVKNKPA